MDASPVAIPPVPRPLKRSASTASLPTPPRTRHKRKHRAKSKGQADDTDTDIEGSGSDSETEKKDGNKKRRTDATNVDEDEDAFWLGSPGARTRSKTVAVIAPTKSPKATTSAVRQSPRSPAKAKNDPVSPATALVRRRQQRQTAAVAPVSPPPSNRKPRKTTKTKVAASPALSSLSSPPATPKADRPVRDTPNNPFLIPSTPGRDTTLGVVLPRTPKKKEGPTVTYVFRGVRGEFPNPHFDHSKGRAKSPTPNSLLPVDHPDYSPDAHALPRLLFPPKRVTRSMTKQEAGTSEQDEPKTPVAGKSTPKASGSRARLLSPFGEDDDEEGGDLRQMKPFTFRLKGSSSLKAKVDKDTHTKVVTTKSKKVAVVQVTEGTEASAEKRAVAPLPKPRSKPASSGKRS